MEDQDKELIAYRECVEESGQWIRRWRKIIFLNAGVMGLNLDQAVCWFLDSWSRDDPWLIPIGILFTATSIFMAWLLRGTVRHYRASIRNRDALVALHEGIVNDDGISRLEILLDQYLASVQEIQKS